MSKAYSNKALPSGTILREWRLEEVLGVGGFGIVYKGRGIYFDELVAIKEYFPSAISERDEESTVVPIDSDAEEVHALGLKKFVEEAKLLWNLSTPSRHPNIVSVRSLFEIHGTAYMVMDFEDGVSLAEVLKRGEKFDEAKLREMVLPVAAGLERAHRVGVLHRDIKPSNILITDSAQPVLIDFGSARFETEGVTSTTVTFHTPPYAAIEQYVKTYDQGPWTDIYALGVVLYRCITGEKPAEVLERLHGEKEPLLVDGSWPGFSREFLAAVDAAMIIKPSERPRSLPEWMAMFDGAAAPAAVQNEDEDDDEATRIAPMSKSVEEIAKAATPQTSGAQPEDAGKARGSKPTAVPDDIDEAKFKMAGDGEAAKSLSDGTTGRQVGYSERDKASGKVAAANAAEESTAKDAKPEPEPNPKLEKGGDAGASKSKDSKPAPAKMTSVGERKRLSKPVIVAGGAGLILMAGLAWSLSWGGEDAASDETVAAAEISHVDGFGPALMKLAELARDKNIDAKVIGALESRAERVASLETENSALSDDESRKEDIGFNRLRIADLTRESLSEFATGLSQELTAGTRRLAATATWADPRRANSASRENNRLRASAAAVAESHTKAQASIASLSAAETAEEAVPLARIAILAFADYEAAAAQALRDNPQSPVVDDNSVADAPQSTSSAATETTVPVQTEKTVSQISSELDQIADATKDRANEVIRLARIREPRSSASEEEKQAFRTLESNANAARDYKDYLDNLRSSMRGADSPAEAEKLLLQGLQTRQYVNNMIRSSQASRAILER